MNSVLSVLHCQDSQSYICFSKLKVILADFCGLLLECVDELSFPLKPSKIQNLSRSRAGAVVITKGFLTFLEENRDFAYKITCCLRPSTTVAFLLGVTEWDIHPIHKTILTSYCAWPKFVLKEGEAIPTQAVSAIRYLVCYPAERTIKTQEGSTAMKNTESLETDKIQRKERTMKNAALKETNEPCPLSSGNRKLEKDFLKNTTEEMEAPHQMPRKVHEAKTHEDTESSEIPVAISDVEGENTMQKNSESAKPLKRRHGVKKKKKVIKVIETFPQMERKHESKENAESKEEIQEKAASKTETLKKLDVGEKTVKKNAQSEETLDIKEVTKNSKLEQTVDPEKKKWTSKNTERSRRKDTLKKQNKIENNEIFELLIDGLSTKYVESPQLLNKGERSNDEENDILKQDEIQVQATISKKEKEKGKKIPQKVGDTQEETIQGNTQSSEIPVIRTRNIEENVTEKSNELHEPLKKSSGVKKKKIAISDNGMFRQKEEKDVEEKTEMREVKDENAEISKEVNIPQKKMAESEEIDYIQKKTKNSESEKPIDVEKKRATSKNTEMSKRKDTLRKRKEIATGNEVFESLENIAGIPLKRTSVQLLNKGKVTIETEEKINSSSENDIQMQVTRNVTSSKTSRKSNDITKNWVETESGELSKTSDKAEKKTKKLRGTESSQTLKATDGKKKKKKKPTENNETSELHENTDYLALNDSSSIALQNVDDDQEKVSKKISKKSFVRSDSIREKGSDEDTDAFLPTEKTEGLEETLTEIVMVPQRVDKDNDCIFLIFTCLLKNLENAYVLLERNIIKETPIHLLNPYVVFFFVPEQFLNVPGTVNVHIRYENRLLDVKPLSIISASEIACSRCMVSEATSPLDLTPSETFRTLEEDDVALCVAQTYNEEDHPCEVNDFPKTDENEFDDGAVRSFLKLFADYGFGELDELALELLTEGNVQEQSGKSSANISGQEVLESVAIRETVSHKKENPHRASLELPSETTSSELRRSESLPLLLSASPAEEDSENGEAEENEEDILYMTMSPGYSDYSGRKPHEILLDELQRRGDTDSSRLNSLSSNIYVSMKLSLDEAENNDAADNELSKSQQELLELLEAFKTKEKTLSEVEGLFKEWLVKHQDSLDDKEDVTFYYPDDDTARKGRKQQFFSLIDLVKLLSGKSKNKAKEKAQPQDAKARQKTDKLKDRCVKTLSKVSNSSASSACSLCSDACLTASHGNQDRKRDSGNHSDSNEDNKNKALTEEEKATKWFIIPPSTLHYCPISGEGTPPSLPSRPPPSVQNTNEKPPDLPTRLPPKWRDNPTIPPVLPPKPRSLQKEPSSSVQGQIPPTKKSKSKNTQTKTKEYKRDASPDYVTAKSHPRSPPKTRDQFKQTIQRTPSQTGRNNYVLQKLKLFTHPPRKFSAPENRTRSNSPRDISNTPVTSRLGVSPLISRKNHRNRYNKSLIPSTRRSTSCPNLLLKISTGDRNESPHTYMELQSGSGHNQNQSYLHSNKIQGSKPTDPPLSLPRS